MSTPPISSNPSDAHISTGHASQERVICAGWRGNYDRSTLTSYGETRGVSQGYCAWMASKLQQWFTAIETFVTSFMSPENRAIYYSKKLVKDHLGPCFFRVVSDVNKTVLTVASYNGQTSYFYGPYSLETGRIFCAQLLARIPHLISERTGDPTGQFSIHSILIEKRSDDEFACLKLGHQMLFSENETPYRYPNTEPLDLMLNRGGLRGHLNISLSGVSEAERNQMIDCILTWAGDASSSVSS